MTMNLRKKMQHCYCAWAKGQLVVSYFAKGLFDTVPITMNSKNSTRRQWRHL